MRKILVTGSAGFIGYRVCQKLLDAGFSVVGVDNMNNYYDIRLKQYRLNLLNAQKNFTFYRADIENRAALDKLIFENHNIDVIINMAARAGVRASVENPFIYYSTNVTGTLNLLELAKKYNIKKFILASTSSLYAGQKMPFSEELPVNTPISPYAASKKAAEIMAFTYHYLYDTDITVFRFFTVYGPAGRPDMSITRFVKWIYEGEPVVIFGDGSQTRDFTYVDDIADGVIKGIKPLGYEIINLGGGMKPVSLNKTVELIEKFSDRKARCIYKAWNKTDIKSTQASIEKARRLLGWQPQISFEDGIKKTVDWYAKQGKDIGFEL